MSYDYRCQITTTCDLSLFSLVFFTFLTISASWLLPCLLRFVQNVKEKKKEQTQNDSFYTHKHALLRRIQKIVHAFQ